jgi:hypothetical protein
MKIVTKSCLTAEIRACFLGVTARKIEDSTEKHFELPADSEDQDEEELLKPKHKRKQK